MNIHQRLLFISTFYQVMQKISSDHVLPIFAGLWYETAEYQESDSCGREIFNYGELFSSPADLVISKFSPDCACDYSSISSYYNFTSMPYGFISMNSNDWKEIIAQPDAALAGEYEIHCANCLSQTSGFPISSESRLKSWYQVMALPFYDCPPYTRLSYDNITYEIGCTTNPTPCLADIIARDLTIPGLESCGHVGLIATYEDSTPSVIEVLNDDPSGIFINPLYGNDSFTSKSSFWGERYGLENATRISMELATNIIEVGIEQSYYDFSYAYSWDYYPGGSENHTEDCKFRCDSFVYYCYEYVGLNIQNTFAYPTSPRTIFSDFICSSNPIGNCQTYITDHIQTPSNITNNDELCIFEGKNRNENTKRQPFHDIFSKLRPILRKESSQKEHLQKLIEMFLSIENFKMRELFVRCLCFEINNMSSTQFSYTVKPLLSQVLWQYQYLLNDNFALAVMEDNLHFYTDHPHCDWLDAYSTLMSNNATDKKLFTTHYVDQQDMIGQAHLISGSRLSYSKQLSEKQKCQYGKFFKYNYHYNSSITQRERSLLWLALSEMKYPASESVQPSFKC